MKHILLSKGKFAIIDDEDYERLMQWKWHCSKRGYAARGHYRKTEDGRKHTNITMHREVMNFPLGKEIDHIDGDKLNNQKSNLRSCDRSQNAKNTSFWNKETSSKYKGVRWFAPNKKWSAQISVDRKSVHLGYFFHECDAAQAYNCAALKHFGAFARYNSARSTQTIL